MKKGLTIIFVVIIALSAILIAKKGISKNNGDSGKTVSEVLSDTAEEVLPSLSETVNQIIITPDGFKESLNTIPENSAFFIDTSGRIQKFSPDYQKGLDEDFNNFSNYYYLLSDYKVIAEADKSTVENYYCDAILNLSAQADLEKQNSDAYGKTLLFQGVYSSDGKYYFIFLIDAPDLSESVNSAKEISNLMTRFQIYMTFVNSGSDSSSETETTEGTK